MIALETEQGVAHTDHVGTATQPVNGSLDSFVLTNRVISARPRGLARVMMRRCRGTCAVCYAFAGG
jgi:hypothetical protein